MLTLAQIQSFLPQATLVGDGATRIDRVHTDSRTLQAGDLFVALRGERFDANDFLQEAKAQGAAAALAHHGLQEAALPGLLVGDTRLALGELAKAWREQWDHPLVAITGSNGKTTVTQMVAAILRAHAGEQSLATQGNLNNDIGLPLTVLRLRDQHTCAVVELGMNHPGEIEYLARIAQPTVALVNNAQREHQEFMATVEAVARENASVFAHVRSGGTAVFPDSDAYTALWRGMAHSLKVLTFGLSASADVHGSAQWQGNQWRINAQTPAGALSYSLDIAGQHNVLNSLAACACALAAGVPLATIAQGLSQFQAVKGRSRTLSLLGRVTLVDDTYNANPDSVRAAIDVLAHLDGPRLLVLGDMGEVGNLGSQFHQEVGQYAQERGIERVLCLGELTRHTQAACHRAEHFEEITPLLARVDQLRPTLRSILVKGSRFMKMERVVEHLQAPVTSTESQAHAA
jgi:UDP-N-acetylmuramoyl-tripeptide--D-alanyl-D-alanine ligase